MQEAAKAARKLPKYPILDFALIVKPVVTDTFPGERVGDCEHVGQIWSPNQDIK